MTQHHDTPRTDKLIQGGCIAANILEYARGLERELAASQAALDQMTEDAVKLKDALEELQQQKRNCIEIIDDDTIEKSELKSEIERLSKLTEDCLNVIRVYCPTFYNDAMERFNQNNK